MSDNKRIDHPTGTETVGHEWDGIEELNTPLPRWWLLTFYASIIFALAYCIAYPALPSANGAKGGLTQWSSRDDLSHVLAARDAQLKPLREALANVDITALESDPKLLDSAIAGGQAVFKVHCVQCHGSGAAGSKGYPNLNDDDWLWGGDIATIEKTIIDGIRQPNHDATRMGQMPAFGRDQMLKGAEIDDLVSYIRFVSGQEKGNASATRGAALFANNCASCHGPDAKGGRQFGAPNLTDKIWLYGGDRATIHQTLYNGRTGVMPAWGGRLDKPTIRMLAAYVHSLGGGEKLPAAVPAAAPAGAPASKAGVDAAAK